MPGEQAFVRTVFAMPPDEWCCAFLVIGDKNTATTQRLPGRGGHL
jgi:hypothetical protein